MRTSGLILCLALLSLGAIAPAQSASEKKEQKTWQIPVFYLTDRDSDKPSYGSKRKYTIDCQHDMNYGTAEVIVADDKKKDSSSLSDKLSWSRNSKSSINTVHIDPIVEPTAENAKSAFFNQLAGALEKSGDDKLCLFVHGAAEGFDDAALDAASLAYCLEYPLVMYSWPSVPKVFSYVVDGGNNEYSQGHFNSFIRDLLEFRKEHPLELIIVSHSMGNRLVVRAAHLLAGSGLVKDAELVSPDIDAETFKHYVLGMEHQQATIRLYTSNKDKMLPLAQMMYGGYYRLGEGVGAVFSPGKGDADEGKAKVRKNKKEKEKGKDKGESKSESAGSRSDSQSQKHSSSAGSTAEEPDSILDKDVVAVPSGQALPEQKRGLAERIDFTAIDQGFRGHSIPFDMLASMIRTDQPGMGLAIVSANPGKGSNLARFMSWSHHLGKVDDKADHDLCKRIVKVLSLKTASPPH